MLDLPISQDLPAKSLLLSRNKFGSEFAAFNCFHVHLASITEMNFKEL